MLLQATRALAKLAENADCRRAFAQGEGGATLPTLVSVLGQVVAAPIVRNALYCLELVVKKKECRLPLMRAGAVPVLVAVLERLFREGSPQGADEAVGDLEQQGERRGSSAHSAQAAAHAKEATAPPGGGRRDARLSAAANGECARLAAVTLAWLAKVRSRWHEMLNEGVVHVASVLCAHTDDRTTAVHAALVIGRLAELPSNRPAVLHDGGKVGLLALSRRATEHVVLSNANWALNQLPEGAVDFGDRSSVVQEHAHKMLTQGASSAVTGAENDRLRKPAAVQAQQRKPKKKGGLELPVI